MLKVLIVDDEPFIMQGLKALIDWRAEGFEIVRTLSNGREAYDYLKTNTVDLIIADIQMPVMTGLELIERIRKENLSDAFFVFLTGYQNFSYAQTAIQYDCMSYLLKPVEKNELLSILRKISNINEKTIEEEVSRKAMEQAYLARNIMALLFSKHDKKNVDYVKNHLQLSGSLCYVDIEFLDDADESEGTDEGELRTIQRKMYEAALEYLKEDQGHCVFDVSQDENHFDIGFLYSEYMGAKKECTTEEYLEEFRKALVLVLNRSVRMFVGKKVPDVESISKSYSSACMLKSLEAFRNKKDIYYYEGEVSVGSNGVVLCKESLDKLIGCIERNDSDGIVDGVDELYSEMLRAGLSAESKDLNVNYLLFQLVHMATEFDPEVDQEEILRFIGEHSVREGIRRGDSDHLKLFTTEYALYLEQLRQNVSGGVLQGIEKEIRDHYRENITLKDLGKKYYVNSSYLGQVFQKKYGMTFKDYLTNYRIKESEKLLGNTDMKISQVAEEVGYKDSDYFVRKFIEINGCTPSKWRKTR